VRCARNLIRPPLGLCLSGPPFALHCDLPIDSNRHKSSSNINRVSPKGLGIPELSAQRALPMPYRSGPAVTVRGGNLIPFSPSHLLPLNAPRTERTMVQVSLAGSGAKRR
jgi:hypothetical protein